MQNLTGKCVKVENEQQAELLQKEAFKQGFSWLDGKKLCYLKAKYFYFQFKKNT